ncbi:hypothetical protein [Candidatus Mycobacterium methanotrophicum]|uniref:Anti-sigma factor NepR domain-containing protein n=1 Tax=Candidatus Mycobacterium methanotrophicum TaxID=2943498 RepID=A0ABY4QKX4_9MYCO|nr:hypothetical protein [Candidatus Mycobacterium methanotrophicum]UQX11132.1 hypothetical protein M5I08_00650 [Candidatus Mycobacterium methanotrophicum]
MPRYDALHDAVSDVLDVPADVLSTPECLGLLERLETELRRLPARDQPDTPTRATSDPSITSAPAE